MRYQKLLIFELAGNEFAIDLDTVEEVVPTGLVTAIPNAPPFLLGLTAIRGRILSVIDSAKRFGLGPSLSSFFLICCVRGNTTAITIDHASLAGDLPVRELCEEEKLKLLNKTDIDLKFLKNAFELFTEEEDKSMKSSGRYFFEIDPNLFVSAEMAARIGEL